MRITPYDELSPDHRPSHSPSRSQPLSSPDAATAANAQPASVENRAAAVADAFAVSPGSMSSSAARPPTQTAIPSRCSPRAVTAVSWSVLPATCPARAGGTRPAIASSVSRPAARRLSAPAATRPTNAATTAVTAIPRPRSTSIANDTNSGPNRESPSGSPEMSE
jgi:hypothetical protein